MARVEDSEVRDICPDTRVEGGRKEKTDIGPQGRERTLV